MCVCAYRHACVCVYIGMRVCVCACVLLYVVLWVVFVSLENV